MNQRSQKPKDDMIGHGNQTRFPSNELSAFFCQRLKQQILFCRTLLDIHIFSFHFFYQHLISPNLPKIKCMCDAPFNKIHFFLSYWLRFFIKVSIDKFNNSNCFQTQNIKFHCSQGKLDCLRISELA